MEDQTDKFNYFINNHCRKYELLSAVSAYIYKDVLFWFGPWDDMEWYIGLEKWKYGYKFKIYEGKILPTGLEDTLPHTLKIIKMQKFLNDKIYNDK